MAIGRTRLLGSYRTLVVGVGIACLALSCADDKSQQRCVASSAGPAVVDHCASAVLTRCCKQYCDGVRTDECALAIGAFGSGGYGTCVDESELDCDGDEVPNADDCDPCDASRYRWISVYVDADQDGRPERSQQACYGKDVPEPYFERVADPDHTDCDDSSPSRWQEACRDADGDGWCASLVECVGEVPVGYRPASQTRRDCDDTNPSLQQWIYADEDGDGFRSDMDHPTACYPEGKELPLGAWTYPGDDCNDHAGAVFPEQAELVGDGIDANCDGSDGRDGAICGDACRCWPTPICSRALTCSERPDLAIVDAIPGRLDCRQLTTALVAVVNLGGVTFSGLVTVSHSDVYGGDQRNNYCWYDTVLALELAPGQSRIIEVDPLCRRTHLLVTAGEDCLLDNNHFQFQPEVIWCP